MGRLAASLGAPLRRPHLLHAAFLVIVVTSLWLLAAQDEIATLHFRRHAVQQHLFQTTRRPQTDSEREGDHDSLPREVEALLRMGDRAVREARGEMYVEDLFAVDWSQHVSRRAVLHLGAIQRACLQHPESVLTHAFGRHSSSELPSDGLVNRTIGTELDRERLLETLRQCPTVDVFAPSKLRSHENCEDAAAYTKYLYARLIPRWVLDIKLFDKALGRNVSYHELCPFTPMIVLGADWGGVRADPAWPPTKPLWLMPNIETTTLGAQHLRQADVVLCKTASCAQYVTMWFEQEGNPRLTKVVYHRFTSSDAATNTLVAAGIESVESSWQTRPKDLTSANFVYFVGATRLEQATAAVLDCWLSRPDLPPLDVYISDDVYRRDYEAAYGARLMTATATIKIHTKKLKMLSLGKTIAQSSFFLFTNYTDGHGHYLNHARAAGGLVVAPDVPPLNELVTKSSGVLYGAKRGGDNWSGLDDTPGVDASLKASEICAVVDQIVTRHNATEYAHRATRARQQFYYDTAFFALKMRDLRAVLRPSSRRKST